MIDVLFNGPAGKWVRASEESLVQDINFEGLLVSGTDNWGEPIPGAPILPGRDFDRVTYDLADWDGISLEMTGYVGEPPNEAERERIFAMGFTVIRIDYADPEQQTRQHKFHGDWSCVKGHLPRAGTPLKETA